MEKKINVTDPKYAAFTALDPFFDIVQQGLVGRVDGDHYFDIAADAEFEFRYHFPGWPKTLRGALLGTHQSSALLRGCEHHASTVAGVVRRTRQQSPTLMIADFDLALKVVGPLPPSIPNTNES